MWHKVAWMGHLVRIELPREGLLAYLANHYTVQDAHTDHKVLLKRLFIYFISK